MTNPYRGIFTPLVTPITPDGSPDLASLRRLVRFQYQAGVHGMWAMGTSGEFASFDEGERAEAVAAVVGEAAGRVPVVANISDASTKMAIRQSKRAADAGADAVAATPPYYYPHTQDELIAHYLALREAVDLPLFIYNIPQTVRVKLELNTVKQLAAEGAVAGIKDSQNDFEWFRQLSLFVQSENVAFALFAGTRHLIDAAIVVGANGAIPSIANAFPELAVAVYEAARGGDFERASSGEAEIIRVESLAAELTEGSRHAASLGLLKAILHDRGVISCPALTSPLRTPSLDERERIVAELARIRPDGL